MVISKDNYNLLSAYYMCDFWLQVCDTLMNVKVHDNRGNSIEGKSRDQLESFIAIACPLWCTVCYRDTNSAAPTAREKSMVPHWMPTYLMESIIWYNFTPHLWHFYNVLVQCVLFQLISVPSVSWGSVPGGMPKTRKDFMGNRCREM